MRRKRGQEMERARIRVKHGEKFGEISLFDTIAFIVYDIDAKEQQIEKATIKPDGSLGAREKAIWKNWKKSWLKLNSLNAFSSRNRYSKI